MIWRHIKILKDQEHQKLTRLLNDGSMDIFVHGSDFHQVSFPFAGIGELTLLYNKGLYRAYTCISPTDTKVLVDHKKCLTKAFLTIKINKIL